MCLQEGGFFTLETTNWAMIFLDTGANDASLTNSVQFGGGSGG